MLFVRMHTDVDICTNKGDCFYVFKLWTLMCLKIAHAEGGIHCQYFVKTSGFWN